MTTHSKADIQSRRNQRIRMLTLGIVVIAVLAILSQLLIDSSSCADVSGGDAFRASHRSQGAPPSKVHRDSLDPESKHAPWADSAPITATFSRSSECRIIDENGDPIAGASVTFAWRDLVSGAPGVEECLSDQHGTARPTRDVPRRIRLTIRCDGFAPALYQWDTTLDLLCVLRRPVRVHGRVTDRQTGQGIGGATIRWRPAYRKQCAEETVECDTTGLFEIQIPAQILCRFEAAASGYASEIAFWGMVNPRTDGNGYSLPIGLAPEASARKIVRIKTTERAAITASTVEVSPSLAGSRTPCNLRRTGKSQYAIEIPTSFRFESSLLYLWSRDHGPALITGAANLLAFGSTIETGPISLKESAFFDLEFVDQAGTKITAPLTLALDATLESRDCASPARKPGGAPASFSRPQDAPVVLTLKEHAIAQDGDCTIQVNSDFSSLRLLVRSEQFTADDVILIDKSHHPTLPRDRIQRVIVLQNNTDATHIKVVDYESAKPLAGATFSIASMEDGFSYHFVSELNCDQMGRATTSLIRGTSAFRFDAPDHAPVTFQIDVGEQRLPPKEIRVAMVRSGHIGGIAVDDMERPLVGVAMEAVPVVRDKEGVLQPARFVAMLSYPGLIRADGMTIEGEYPYGATGCRGFTDNKGRFSIHGLLPEGFVRPSFVVPNYFRVPESISVPVNTDDIRIVVYRAWPVYFTAPDSTGREITLSIRTVSSRNPSRKTGSVRDYSASKPSKEYLCATLDEGAYSYWWTIDGNIIGGEHALVVDGGGQSLVSDDR